MTQQVVNIGTVADDGTGDPVRVAFGKVNNNFSELYGLALSMGAITSSSYVTEDGTTPYVAEDNTTLYVFADTISGGGGDSGGSSSPGITVVITGGATSISPFQVVLGTGVVLIKQGGSTPSWVQFPLAPTTPTSVLVKDIKGDAFTNNTTIQFSGTEKCDGLPTVVLGNNYAWATINSIPGGGGWYQS
jgi:hypothetical protein